MRPVPEMRGTPGGALLRAAVAGLLMLVLLYFVLAQTPQSETVQPEVAAPAPAVSEPPPSLLLPQDDAPQAEAESQVSPSADLAAPIIAPLPEVAPSADAAPPASPEPEPVPAAAPPAPKSPAPAAAPGTRPHLVQLADFGPLPAARNLLDAAAGAGHPGRILHRVLVGPFASREAARKAVEAGIRGIVVDSGGSWWVQAGVFSDAENADRQRATLAMEGRQVVVHGRAEIGPFASRAAAEKALSELRAALGKPLRDAAIVATR